METVVKRVIVPFTPKQIYSIINDIDAYPSYLPFCDSTQILEKSLDGRQTKASMTLSLAGLPFTIITLNTGTPYNQMDLMMIRGPFKSFYGTWQLHQPCGDKDTLVEFQLKYDLGLNPATLFIAPVFRMVADHFINSFISRAEELYGPNH